MMKLLEVSLRRGEAFGGDNDDNGEGFGGEV